MSGCKETSIKGYLGYKISITGTVWRKNSKGIWREVKSQKDINNNYNVIALWKNGRRKTHMIHNLVSENFGISVEDAKRVCYKGYYLTPGAKENVRDILISLINKKENEYKHDEVLYLKDCLEVLSK